MMKKKVVGVFLAGLMVTAMTAVQADSSAGYPDRTINLIVPFPAGQATDTLARTLGKEISTLSGQTVVVENKPGGSGAIAAKYVASSKPDGYTLIFGSQSPMAGNMSLIKKPGYDAQKDFEPVALVAQTGWLVAVEKNSPYETFADLVTAAREKPGTISIGGGSVGYQMAARLVAKLSEIDLLIVPYVGTPHLVTDVLGGHVEAIAGDLGTISRLVDAGSMRALVALTPERMAALPDVPTLKELGHGELPLEFSWMGIFVPKGTPLAVREKLADLIDKAIQSDSVTKYMTEQRMDAAFMGPEDFAKLQNNEIVNYREAMQLVGMQAN